MNKITSAFKGLMTAFLRGFVILVDAENSASAVDIGFVSAMPPSLAERDKRCRRLSQGGDWPVKFRISFVLIFDSKGSSRFPISLMVRDRYVHLLERPWVNAAWAA